MATSLILFGITADMAFAAGCALLALRRHSPNLDADVWIYTDGCLPEHDTRLLRNLGTELVPYVPPPCMLQPATLKLFSHLCLARFEGLRLLSRYRHVIWLDVDTALQDDISPLFEWGPLSLAREDPHFTDSGTSQAGINFHPSLPASDPSEKTLVKPDLAWFDVSAPNLNSGILVLRDDLPDPASLYRQCLDWLTAYGPHLKYPDQAVLNMLAQTLTRTHPQAIRLLPHDRFNAHPRNPAALSATIVHAFGAYKLWDDGLTRCAFPEWQRDYLRWQAMGGTPWQGPVDNQEFLDGGPFFMLRRLFDATTAADTLLERQQAELVRERTLRATFERLLSASTKET